MQDELIETNEVYKGSNRRLGWSADEKEVEYKVFKQRSNGTPALVTFGRGGSTVYYMPRKEGTLNYGVCRREGYDTPDNFFAPSRWWAHDYATRTDPEPYEGVAFVDMREAVEHDAGVKMSISGPMVDITLPPGEIARCPEPSDLLALAVAGNEFGALLSIQGEQRASGAQYGALDSVDIATYQRLWKAAGAKIGKVKDGQFVEYTEGEEF
jgi:hypothetical protein